MKNPEHSPGSSFFRCRHRTICKYRGSGGIFPGPSGICAGLRRNDRRWRRSSNKPYTYLQLIYQCISKFPWQTTQVFGLVAVFPQVLVGHTARVFDVATGIYMKKVPAQSWHLSHRNLHKLYTFHRTPYTPHYHLLPSHTTLCCRLTHLAITSVPQHGQKQAVHILAAYPSLHVAQFPWQTTWLMWKQNCCF